MSFFYFFSFYLLKLKHLVKVSYGRSVEQSLRVYSKTPEYSIPVLGAGVKELAYITKDAHSKIYRLFSNDETIVISRIGKVHIRYFDTLSIAPTEDTYILQNLEPELLYFKYLYYKLLSLEEYFNHISNGTVIKHLQINDIRNIVL